MGLHLANQEAEEELHKTGPPLTPQLNCNRPKSVSQKDAASRRFSSVGFSMTACAPTTRNTIVSVHESGFKVAIKPPPSFRIIT